MTHEEFINLDLDYYDDPSDVLEHITMLEAKIQELKLIIKGKDVIIESMAQGKSLPKYDAKFNCLNCGTSLKVVDMEAKVTREECPFCGCVQLVKSRC